MKYNLSESENEEYPNERGSIDRGCLIMLTSMTKGEIVEYMFSLISKVKDKIFKMNNISINVHAKDQRYFNKMDKTS